MTEKWKCDFRGCKEKAETLTSYSDFYPTKNSKHWKSIEGKRFCDKHVEHYEKLMEKEGIVFKKPEVSIEIEQPEEIKKAEDETSALVS